jgi:hypothetical protein
MRSRTRNITLFRTKEFREVKSEKLRQVETEIENENPDRISGVEKDEYVDYIISKYRIEPVEIDLDAAQIDVEDFSRDETPELVIPVSGNTDLLGYTPSRRTMNYSCSGTLDGNELRVEIVNSGRRGRTGEKLNKEIGRVKTHIEDRLEYLRSNIRSYHQELERKAESRFESRREEIREQREILGSLDVPLRKDEDTPDTFAIDGPIQREQISLEPPEPEHETAGQPAPTVAESTYKDVLNVISDVGRGFERSPRLFNDLEEEDLRDHILFVLEQNFEGTATGETFNKEGKSDILLRADDGTNVFVAECAIWGGEKYYSGKIDQLFRYLTWRDSKTAVILFVQNEQMEPVREQIESGAESHEAFVEAVEQPDESWWQYRFCFPDDPDRELDLAVLAFHIPPTE